MTVFAKKMMNVAVWTKVQAQIGALQSATGAPHDLMMLCAETRDPLSQEIYIGLPDAQMLSSFPGFMEVDQANLPDFLTTLVVREDGFQEMFPDIYRKRTDRF